MNHTYTVYNRASKDKWTFEDEARARAFTKFVIDEFVANHAQGEDIRKHFGTDIIIKETDENDNYIQQWLGININ